MKRVRLAFAPMAALVWSGLMLSGPSFAQPPLNLPNTTITTGAATYQADSITAAQGFTIGGNASVSFAATNPSGSVDLRPGFHAIAGSTFHAFMGTNSVLPGNLSWTANQPVTADGYTFQPFTFSASSTNGSQDLAHFYIMFSPGPTQNAVNGCFLFYTAASNTLELANDANNNWAGGGTVPSSAGSSSGVFANSQCKVDLGQSYVSGSGSTLSLTVALYFTPNPNFFGSELIFLNADTNGGFSSDYQAIGVWDVGQPPVVNLSLASASAAGLVGSAAQYTVTVTAPGGFSGTLSASGLPTWASATFGTYTAGCTVCVISLTVTVQASAPIGTAYFNIAASGTSGSVTASLVTQDFTVSILPSDGYNNPLAAYLNIAAGATANFTLRTAPINGFAGTMNYALNTLDQNHWGAATFTLNADGSTTLSIPSSAQFSQTGYFNLTVFARSASGASFAQKNLTGQIHVTASPVLSLYASLRSQTVATTSYNIQASTANFSGDITLGLSNGGCATVVGSPVLGVASGSSQSSGILTIATGNCAVNSSFPITITGMIGTTLSATTNTTLVTGAPMLANILTPAPGSTIPGGATQFTWSAGVGISQYNLSIGTVKGGGDIYSTSSAAQPAQISLPSANGPVYVSLTSVIAGTSQTPQYYAYTVNPSPSQQTLLLAQPTATAHVGNNGKEVQFAATFSQGDATTLTGGCTSTISGVTAHVASVNPVGALPNTAMIALIAAPGTPAQLGQVTCSTSSGVLVALDDSADDYPHIDSVIGLPAPFYTSSDATIIPLTITGGGWGTFATAWICGPTGPCGVVGETNGSTKRISPPHCSGPRSRRRHDCGDYICWDNKVGINPLWAFFPSNNKNSDIVGDFCSCPSPGPWCLHSSQPGWISLQAPNEQDHSLGIFGPARSANRVCETLRISNGEHRSVVRTQPLSDAYSGEADHRFRFDGDHYSE